MGGNPSFGYDIEERKLVINEAEAKVVIGNVLVFIFRFSLDQLGLDWSERRLSDPEWAKLNQYAEFYEVQRAHVLDTLGQSDIPTIECPTCGNDTFDTESATCVLCGHREPVLECKNCSANYLGSCVEYDEAGICPHCEWEDGYAAANHEKY